jgi:hypothetical protein
MFLALSLLLGQGPTAAQENSEVTRSVKGSFASHFHNRKQEQHNKAIVQRVYDEIFGQGNTELVNELFSETFNTTRRFQMDAKL